MSEPAFLSECPQYAFFPDGKIWMLSQRGCPYRRVRNSEDNTVILRDVRGHKMSVRAHRVIAMALVPNPDACRFVRHKNGNTQDNSREHLEWYGHADTPFTSTLREYHGQHCGTFRKNGASTF